MVQTHAQGIVTVAALLPAGHHPSGSVIGIGAAPGCAPAFLRQVPPSVIGEAGGAFPLPGRDEPVHGVILIASRQDALHPLGQPVPQPVIGVGFHVPSIDKDSIPSNPWTIK